MKTIKFIAAAVMCMLSLSANAQTKMIIELDGGKQMELPVSSITSIKWFTNETTTPTTPDVSPSGVQAVDLGLSVKWANMNIGATTPEGYGDYFAWGETVGYKGGKKTFNESTYKYYMSSTEKDADGFYITGYTKYVRKSHASEYGYDGFYDDKYVLDPEDDAATANWGGTWRMPTEAELDELRTKCTWEWKELNGKKGYKVTSRTNGNFIFLPAAGDRSNSGLSFAGSIGSYWSSMRYDYSSDKAYYLYLSSSSVYWGNTRRYFGQSIRAVCP